MNGSEAGRLDVVGIGNALVDVLSHVDDAFLAEHGVERGIMHLIDLERAADLYGMQDRRTEVSGGSAANTMAGIAMLGGAAGYIGKVCDDHLGGVFADGLARLGISFSTPKLPTGGKLETGRSMVLISPDGERTMNTYLGAAEFLSPADMDSAMISRTRWIYLEGFRLDGPESGEAFRKAVRLCHGAGGSVALALSDPFCVDRHRDAFRDLISGGIDLLVCNRDELMSMYQTGGLEEALDLAASEVPLVACTASENGAVIAQKKLRIRVDAFPAEVIDATGAGDLFAAGLLHGLVSGRDLKSAGMMGCAAAAEVISHVGARPQVDLRKHFSELGLPGA